MFGLKLLFDRSKHNALDKILLHKRIDAKNRQGCKYNDGSLQNFRVAECNLGGLKLEAFGCLDNQIIQFQLQRP